MKYYGTKLIEAWHESKDGEPGYGVKYADDYVSWSPKNAFEAAYQPLDAMNFGHALAALKDGHRVAREGWNGKGMWILLVNADEYSLESYKYFSAVGHLPFIAMKTADEKVVPWLCSQTDMLADDWQIVE